MQYRFLRAVWISMFVAGALPGCLGGPGGETELPDPVAGPPAGNIPDDGGGDPLPNPTPTSTSTPTPRPTSTSTPTPRPTSTSTPTPTPTSQPPGGTPTAGCAVPTEARAEDVSNPRTVVGNGTPSSCTGDAFIAAVAKGGVITFNCGPDPVTIKLDRTAKIFNDTGPKIVIDGGGKVTLSGQGRVRILYMNTCDAAQHWTTSTCQNQDHPQLTVQNITFQGGNSKGETVEGGGGGAIFARGGRLKIVNSRFFNNVCDDTGPDVGGAAVRVLSQYQNLPAYVVNSTFGGAEGYGNTCSNGGGLSSIGVSYTVLNSVFTHNNAIGWGGNPSRGGTPGGGSGGAIYNDGNRFTLTVCGSRIEKNVANEFGGAIFYVSNDRTGTLVIQNSTLRGNPSGNWETPGYPGIFYLGNGNPQISGSTLEK